MGNSASSLPYSIGKQVAFVNHGWALHEGQRKSDDESVSVFLAKKPNLHKTPIQHRQPNLSQYQCAVNHYQTSKKLRHPHILQVYATLDTDNPNDTAATGMGNPNNVADNKKKGGSETGDLIIVTEPCIPFDTWLKERNPTPEQVAWGLECIVRGLHFLHASANLCHGNLSPESFFVTLAGDVKIWNFGITSSFISGGNNNQVPRHFIDWEGLVTPQEYRSPERLEGRWDVIGTAHIHCLDSYGMGILIGHIFHGRIPTPLVKAVQRLQTSNIKMRPRLQPLLKCPIFNTPYQKLQLQLEEFAVQDVNAKIMFFGNLTPNLQMQIVDVNVAKYKLLPLIKNEVQTICLNETMRTEESYRKQVLSMLNPLFYIAENFLDTETVGKQLGKVIGILFKVNDRAVRGTLLQKAPFMSENFDKNTLNEAVFEPMCSGFSDSSGALRELTLKSTAALVPHLTHPNLEKLARYLVRLQSDQETSIRTNTVIFFSKLAPYLTETTREKMLLPAFVRAMKDPFTPCRLAALKSTLKAKEFFNPQGVATRVMPAVTPQLLDPSAEVRREAFAAVDDLLFVLRQESERLSHLPEPNATNPAAAATANGTASAAAPMARRSAAAGGTSTTQKAPEAPKSGGFSLGGISSWMTSKAVPDEAPKSAPMPAPSQQQPARPMMTTQQQQQQHQPVGMSVASSVPAASTAPMNSLDVKDDGGDDWGDEDGWDDDDLDVSGGGGGGGMRGLGAPAPAPTATTSGSLFAPPTAAATTDDDDFFGSFNAQPAKPAAMRKMGTGKLVVPSKKAQQQQPKAPVKKLALDDSVNDGWDDF